MSENRRYFIVKVKVKCFFTKETARTKKSMARIILDPRTLGLFVILVVTKEKDIRELGWLKIILQRIFICLSYVGLAFSSCKLLSINNESTPFNGPKGPLCFNGRFTDAYYLDFTHLHHKAASRLNEKLMSYTSLNVAHDDKGRRIQSIDYELAEFAVKISKLENTLTVLMADHGNTYTHYTHAVMEGRYEQYHPALFMIVPNKVKKTLGEEIMQNLRINQFKLFTMLDLHKAFINIPKSPSPTGVFGYISEERTCDDLDLRLPNFCVCEGWDTSASNETSQAAILDFAVGKLNNKIQLHQKNTRANRLIPKCKHLVPTSFYNVRERNNGTYLITSLDFMTESGDGATQTHDVFHVQVQSEINRKKMSRSMKLLNFDRISKYGPYRACADQKINMRLCVCDLTSNHTNTNDIKSYQSKELLKIPKLFKYKLEEKNYTCLVLQSLSYPDTKSDDKSSVFSVSFRVTSFCKDVKTISLKLAFNNMKLTTDFTESAQTVEAFSSMYIGSVVRDVPYWDSTLDSKDLTIV